MPPKRNRRGIDPATKILIALNFYARGSYQGSVAQNADAPMAQQTVSRCLRQVTAALNASSILRKYLSHVAIVTPSHNEERFFNRKHFHSLNTQVICDSDCKNFNVDASYGGATHDAFIWAECEIKGHLEGLQTTETTYLYLLGDSGYPQREYMMIPIGNVAEDTPEGHYNMVHKRARSTVERTFGILKGRWRCFLAARELHYHPKTAARIILACCVLHNMCIEAGVTAPELSEDELQAEESRQVSSQPALSSTEALRRGQRERERVVQLLGRT